MGTDLTRLICEHACMIFQPLNVLTDVLLIYEHIRLVARLTIMRREAKMIVELV